MEDFNQHYEELLELEDDFKKTLTGYATGDNVSLFTADKQFRQIKKKLKAIRKLAKELRHDKTS